MKKHEHRSDFEVKQLAITAIREDYHKFWDGMNVFDQTAGQERALEALLLRLGYSPHNAFAHGRLIPLADDPRQPLLQPHPKQPVLDK